MNIHPQGTNNATHRYKFIARTLAFLYRGEQVLLLKGAPHKRLWANRYNGIGGHVEQGESILDSALREVREETGIPDVTNFLLRGIITVDTHDNPGILLFVFTAITEQASIQSSDEGMPEWVDWRSLPPESMVEDVPILLAKLAAMLPSDPPFFAHYSYDDANVLSIRFADG